MIDCYEMKKQKRFAYADRSTDENGVHNNVTLYVLCRLAGLGVYPKGRDLDMVDETKPSIYIAHNKKFSIYDVEELMSSAMCPMISFVKLVLEHYQWDACKKLEDLAYDLMETVRYEKHPFLRELVRDGMDMPWFLTKMYNAIPEPDKTYMASAIQSIKVYYPYVNHLHDRYAVDIRIPRKKIEGKEPLVWLAEKQGCTKEELADALGGRDVRSIFLNSLVKEDKACPTESRELVFSTTLNLSELILCAKWKHQEWIKKREESGKGPEEKLQSRPEKNYVPTLELSNKTHCGFSDYQIEYQGPFGIILERGVRIPLDDVRLSLQDPPKRKRQYRPTIAKDIYDTKATIRNLDWEDVSPGLARGFWPESVEAELKNDFNFTIS